MADDGLSTAEKVTATIFGLLLAAAVIGLFGWGLQWAIFAIFGKHWSIWLCLFVWFCIAGLFKLAGGRGKPQ